MNERTQIAGNILITVLLHWRAGGQGTLILLLVLSFLFHALSWTLGPRQSILAALEASVPEAHLQPLSWAQVWRGDCGEGAPGISYAR